jgi:glycosyltransferase involved in cell wall biosynthesis
MSAQDDACPTPMPAKKHGRQAAVQAASSNASYRTFMRMPFGEGKMALPALDVDYEIIFVNDGSPDDTDRVLATLTANDDHVIAVEHSRNFGAQNAFLSGMALTTGDGVVLLDGDLQDPPEVIPALFEKWRQGNDVVYARRAKRAGSVSMSVCYKAFYRVFRRMSDVPCPSTLVTSRSWTGRSSMPLWRFPRLTRFCEACARGLDSDRPAWTPTGPNVPSVDRTIAC